MLKLDFKSASWVKSGWVSTMWYMLISWLWGMFALEIVFNDTHCKQQQHEHFFPEIIYAFVLEKIFCSSFHCSAQCMTNHDKKLITISWKKVSKTEPSGHLWRALTSAWILWHSKLCRNWRTLTLISCDVQFHENGKRISQFVWHAQSINFDVLLQCINLAASMTTKTTNRIMQCKQFSI